MDETHDVDAETEHPPYVRLPWPLVAVGLLGVLAIILAIGLFANRYLRPQVGVVPTAIPTLAALAATSTPPSATLAPTPAPTAVVQVQVAVTATPPSATRAPTSTPPPLVSPTPLALPTVDPVLADEVGRAYVMFWRVRSQALLELDTTHLSDVMDGDYLTNVSQRIDELRTEGRAIKTQVVLNYSVIEASTDSASVVDYFKDNSIYVKIDTDEPLSTPTADQLNVLYRLRKFSDVWKVVDSVRSN